LATRRVLSIAALSVTVRIMRPAHRSESARRDGLRGRS
jgi:hypothetical protein